MKIIYSDYVHNNHGGSIVKVMHKNMLIDFGHHAWGQMFERWKFTSVHKMEDIFRAYTHFLTNDKSVEIWNKATINVPIVMHDTKHKIGCACAKRTNGWKVITVFNEHDGNLLKHGKEQPCYFL